MQLSIVIVNYNVRYFLEHCLRSVSRACASIKAEIIVVDNRSTDGSVEMVMEKFPDVILIANQENTGADLGGPGARPDSGVESARHQCRCVRGQFDQ